MKEEEIRPQILFEEYLALTISDVETYFSNVPRKAIDCPACEVVGYLAFSKNGFDYALCQECCALFVSPCPETDFSFNRLLHERSQSSSVQPLSFVSELMYSGTNSGYFN